MTKKELLNALLELSEHLDNLDASLKSANEDAVGIRRALEAIPDEPDELCVEDK